MKSWFSTKINGGGGGKRCVGIYVFMCAYTHLFPGSIPEDNPLETMHQ